MINHDRLFSKEGMNPKDGNIAGNNPVKRESMLFSSYWKYQERCELLHGVISWVL
jgi:hypothetical protein